MEEYIGSPVGVNITLTAGTDNGAGGIGYPTANVDAISGLADPTQVNVVGPPAWIFERLQF